MDPVNKIKFVDEDGSSVVLDVPMTARGERKEALPVEKMVEIEEEIEAAEEKVEEEIKAAKEKVEEEIKDAEDKVEEVVKDAVEKVEEEIKDAVEKVEKELQEVNALVNDIKEQGIQEVTATIENIEIKIKPPKGCCVIQ